MKALIKKCLKTIILQWYRLCTKVCKVRKDTILFESNLGRNYTGNPRYIYEEMVKQGLDQQYHCYFILENPQITLPGAGKTIKRSRLRYFYLLATAGIWVCDSRLPRYVIKRPETAYIQTWHGTPLKKLALDMEEVSMAGETTIESYKKNFYENAQTWDYLISQNAFSTAIFRRAFAFKKQILEIGYPRNDILIRENNPEKKAELKKKFHLPEDKKVILYAPTWRDNEFYGKGKYKFGPQMAFGKMQKELGKEYCMIVKYHYLVMDNINWEAYQDFIYACDLHYDIAELYLVADLLITDYSSVMFDYSLLKRPIFFYVYDLENYQNNIRGFYFDLVQEAPGPISLKTEDLIDDIQHYDPQKYEQKYDAFIQKYNSCDQGTAAKQVVELICDLTQNEKGKRK